MMTDLCNLCVWAQASARSILTVTLTVVIAACQAPSDQTPPSQLEDAHASQPHERTTSDTLEPSVAPSLGAQQQLAPRELFVRASIDLTGARPSPDELRALDEDPSSLPARLDALIEDPRFLNRVRYIFAPAFKTLIDSYEPIEVLDRPHLSRAIGEEPLNLLAHLVSLDRPFSELVTAPYTVVDADLLEIWPLSPVDEDTAVTALELTERHPELLVATYTDGRPMSGVLSMNSMWWRHTSTIENANRGRAEALSQALLCEGWLDRPILFPTDVDLTDSEAMRSAISTHPACVSCHATLDPLASFFWGFMNEQEDLQSLRSYLPQQELDWREQTGAAPALFGQRGEHLVDLGRSLVADPRFSRCATRRVYEALIGRMLAPSELDVLDLHHQRFVASGLNIKRLVQSVIYDEAYRSAAVSPIISRDQAVGVKVMSASLLASELSELTGYTPHRDGRSLMQADLELRSVAGGGTHRSAPEPSAGLTLTHIRLAEGAAWHLISGEGLEGADGGLLGQLLMTADLERAPTIEVIEALRGVASSRPQWGDPESTLALVELSESLAADAEDISEVWRGLLTAIIADPARLLY